MLLQPELEHLSAFVFDLDGTLYQEGRPIEGALQTVQALEEDGRKLRFLTNTTSKSRRLVYEKLNRFGFSVEEDQIYSPPVAAGQYLRERQASAHLLVQEAALPDFEGVPRDDTRPDYVVVGDLGAAWTFEKLNRAFRLVQEQEAGLIGLGRTRFWHAASGLQLDAGPFVAALEYAAGRDALILGKPAPDFFDAILDDLHVPAEQVALIGDDIKTDVEAAMKTGFYGVLVRTGKFRREDLEHSEGPDLVLGSVTDVYQQNGPAT